MNSIRDLFSTSRPITRRIEKVIDYAIDEEKRLQAEIEEYEVTDNLEECFRKFVDHYREGVKNADGSDIGVWVSGFYGSGKSSFTKYLGFALDTDKRIGNRRFLDLLCDRFRSASVSAGLRTVANQFPAAVIMLDLGAEQLVESAMEPVSTVLYWKVLQWAGYSLVKKTTWLELLLEKQEKYEEFQELYHKEYGEDWFDVHNDPLISVSNSSDIAHKLLPAVFRNSDAFMTLETDVAQNTRQQADDIIQIIRRKTGHDNILLLIDEAGQYVAHNNSLILNFDGLARNLKKLGQGKVWIAATGQQTLAEIVEKAALNSQELNRLRARFPISIDIDASDIKEIT